MHYSQSLAVPESMKKLVLKSCHGSLMAGNLGSSKMILKVRMSFHWFRMYADCTQFVQACKACALLNGINRKPKSPLFKRACGTV